MQLDDLFKDANQLTGQQLERRLNSLCARNYRYKNLDAKNRKVLLESLKKFLPHVRRGVALSHSTIHREYFRLYQKRKELDLTNEDLKDIKEILNELRKS